jgi:hypothetical protein
MRCSPRRDDARRSCACAFVHRENRFFTGKRSLCTKRFRKRACKCVSSTLRTTFPSHTHGGLTPAAPGCAFASRRTMFDSRCTMFGSPSHGGMTPAAPVNVRLCIAKIVFSPANVRSAPRAGGVSPPWNANVLIRREPLAFASALPNSGAVMTDDQRFRCSPRDVRHGGLTPAAPGCAFASR